MRFLIKPLKLLLFALALYGISQIKYKDQKLISYLHNWISHQKSKMSQSDLVSPEKKLKWAKDKALKTLKTTQKNIANELKENISSTPLRPDKIVPFNHPDKFLNNSKEQGVAKGPVKLIPGTKIPDSNNISSRKKKIIQKLDLENELISGQDKRALEDILKP